VAIGMAATPAPAPAPEPAKTAAPPPVSTIPSSITAEALAGPSPAADGVDTKRMMQALMTKAGLRPDFGLRHLSWDQARRLNALMPKAKVTIDPVKPFAIALDTRNGKEALHCLSQAAYYEAGANGSDAEAAVAQVVLNRVRDADFPKSVCGVVYQGSERDSGCQFTFTCDGALARPLDRQAWDEAQKVAARALSGYVVKTVGASTYYHADYVFPAWAPTLEKIAKVGPHIFYSVAGEESSLLTGRYAGGELKLASAILKATDRFGPKPQTRRAADAPLQVASLQTSGVQSPANVAPAGLKAQADRLQRVHVVMAAAHDPMAGVHAEDQAIMGAAPVQIPDTATPSPAPVQTADAQGPAA
jgi:spore germination cell wall hydrolase CwlJ-like protein